MSDNCFNPILDVSNEFEVKYEETKSKFCKGCKKTKYIKNFYFRIERKGKYQYMRYANKCKTCASAEAYANKLKNASIRN